MWNLFSRQAAGYANELRQSCAILTGIANGLIADKVLTDAEILFLGDWLKANSAIANAFPGDVLYQRVRSVLADGVITEEERAHLVQTLTQICGGSMEALAQSPQVNQLALDQGARVTFTDATFCLTGDFVFGPRNACTKAIELRGGEVKSSVVKSLDFLVVGALGSPEWKHGSFGNKIDRAIANKRAGAPTQIVSEDQWTAALSLIRPLGS